MPRVPDASSVTRLRAIQSSAVSDPVKRSASYVPAQPTLLYSLRASEAGRGMFPAGTFLANPIACGYVNPRHQGYITGPSAAPPAPTPQLEFDLGETDFETETFTYTFSQQDVIVPPGPDFDVVLLNGLNLTSIAEIEITSADNDEVFGDTTISTSLTWEGATFTSNLISPNLLSAEAFPEGALLRFRNVPVIAGVIIHIYPPE